MSKETKFSYIDYVLQLEKYVLFIKSLEEYKKEVEENKKGE